MFAQSFRVHGDLLSSRRRVLVTGADGFIGRNLCAQLALDSSVELLRWGRFTNEPLEHLVDLADAVVHLAGQNRPKESVQFERVNVDLTRRLIEAARQKPNPPLIVFASSTQAELENPYGHSKAAAELLLLEYSAQTSADVYILRLPNVFGKWSRPDYNSVVATFCFRSVRGLDLAIHDPEREITLVHVDSVVGQISDCLGGVPQSVYVPVRDQVQIELQELANTIQSFVSARTTKKLPDLGSSFHRALYGTLSSFYDIEKLDLGVELVQDQRGWLFELLKSPTAGQVFLSSTRPGLSRGDHWHHNKVEKFTVIAGSGVLTFRQVGHEEIVSYQLSGDDIRIVDVPVGYVHAIENTGTDDLLLVVWASEILDKKSPDTYYEKV